ncbi:MAG TPA: SAVED domain-containing protein [Opitutaceae bacterium]|jgi:hypothetical protein|nr:SAVED domain-containing protein [Opitutaceae bacterium]
MSTTSISDSVKCALWGKAAGQCEYSGCRHLLWKDALTQREFSSAYLAHIIADRPNGPRGDPVLSPLLAADPSNLMLLCDVHHRLIDKGDVAGHPVDFLRRMKEEHERRVELQTAGGPDRQTEILCYWAGIGEHAAPMDYHLCAEAVRPHRYPASHRGIGLGLKESAVRDSDESFWSFHEAHLRRQFTERVRPRLADGELRHLSLFAIAPQPLLMLLGYLLSDISAPVDTFQRRREPVSWAWPDRPKTSALLLDEPAEPASKHALVFSLSATVTDERIHAVLGKDCAIWKLRFEQPHHDVVQDRSQLADFRRHCRYILDRIKANSSKDQTLHVFPAMPISTAIEFGRVIQAKADMAMTIYDQQQPRGFMPALSLRQCEPVAAGIN